MRLPGIYPRSHRRRGGALFSSCHGRRSDRQPARRAGSQQGRPAATGRDRRVRVPLRIAGGPDLVDTGSGPGRRGLRRHDRERRPASDAGRPRRGRHLPRDRRPRGAARAAHASRRRNRAARARLAGLGLRARARPAGARPVRDGRCGGAAAERRHRGGGRVGSTGARALASSRGRSSARRRPGW